MSQPKDSFANFDSADHLSKGSIEARILKELPKEMPAARFLTKTDIKSLSFVEKSLLKDRNSTKQYEQLKAVYKKIDAIAQARIEKLHEQVKAHERINEVGKITFNGTSLQLWPRDKRIMGVGISLSPPKQAKPNYLDIYCEDLTKVLDDVSLMIEAQESALKADKGIQEEHYQYFGNELLLNSELALNPFREAGQKINYAPMVFVHVLNGRLRKLKQSKEKSMQRDQKEQEKLDTVRAEKSKALSKEIQENKEWLKLKEERKEKDAAFKKELYSQYEQGELPHIANTLWQMEYLGDGVPDEIYTKAMLSFAKKYQELNAIKPKKIDLGFVQTIMESMSPKGSYHEFHSSALRTLTNGNFVEQNCHAGTTLFLAMVSSLYPEERESLKIQLFSSHIRPLITIDGVDYVAEVTKQSITPLKKDKKHLTKNSMVASADVHLKSYAGPTEPEEWDYYRNGPGRKHEKSDLVTSSARDHNRPNFALSRFGNEISTNVRIQNFEETTNTNQSPQKQKERVMILTALDEALIQRDLKQIESLLKQGHKNTKQIQFLGPGDLEIAELLYEYKVMDKGQFFFIKNKLKETTWITQTKAWRNIPENWDEIIRNDELSEFNAKRLSTFISIALLNKEKNPLSADQWQDLHHSYRFIGPKYTSELLTHLIPPISSFNLENPQKFNTFIKEMRTNPFLNQLSLGIETEEAFAKKMKKMNRMDPNDWKTKDTMHAWVLFSHHFFPNLRDKHANTIQDYHGLEQRLGINLKIDALNSRGEFLYWKEGHILYEKNLTDAVKQRAIKNNEGKTLEEIFNEQAKQYTPAKPSEITAASMLKLISDEHTMEASLMLQKDAGSDFNVRNKYNQNAFDIIIKNRDGKAINKLIERLEKYGYDFEKGNKYFPFDRSHLIRYVLHCNFPTKKSIDLLIDKEKDINHQDALGRTALMYAVMMGNQEMAEYLVSKGANPDLIDTMGINLEQMVPMHNNGEQVIQNQDMLAFVRSLQA